MSYFATVTAAHLRQALVLGAACLVGVPLACGGSSSPVDSSNPISPDAGGGGTGGDDGGVATGDDGTGGGEGGVTQGDGGGTQSKTAGKIQTVFLVMMENHSWSTIKGNPSAKYINDTLLPMGAHAEKYSTPAHNHPSEPNYIWLEAGDNLGITTDDDPSANHQSTKDHLSTQLEAAGFTWKAYVEGIAKGSCPLASNGLFAAKHTPQLFFDDVTDGNKSSSAHCQQHVRPYEELGGDLKSGMVAQFNFITPDLCDDMHGEALGTQCEAVVSDMVKKGDDWLASEVPAILASNAYKNGGMLMILWDEGDEPLFGTASDGPLPAIVISPFAKVNYPSQAVYTHSSTLRTFQEIFHVPFLRGAQTSNDLSDMFTSFP